MPKKPKRKKRARLRRKSKAKPVGKEKFAIRALQIRGPKRAYYAGNRFDFKPSAAVLLTRPAAEKLLSTLKAPRGWRLGLLPVGLLPRGRNPLSPQTRKLHKAARLFEDFTGHTAERVDKVKMPSQSVFLVPGVVEVIGYTTVRDGQVEDYLHEFKGRNKPMMAITPDGRQVVLKGGFRFTEKGFEDQK